MGSTSARKAAASSSISLMAFNGTVVAMTVTGAQTYLTVLLLVLSIVYTIIKLMKIYKD